MRAIAPLKALLRILCACAVLFVASVHQPPARALAASDSIDLSAYMLPDGTLPVLCLSASDEEGKRSTAGHQTGCDACRLTATPDLLAPSCAVFRPAGYRVLARPWIPDTAALHPVPIFHVAQRGPPVSGSPS